MKATEANLLDVLSPNRMELVRQFDERQMGTGGEA